MIESGSKLRWHRLKSNRRGSVRAQIKLVRPLRCSKGLTTFKGCQNKMKTVQLSPTGSRQDNDSHTVASSPRSRSHVKPLFKGRKQTYENKIQRAANKTN